MEKIQRTATSSLLNGYSKRSGSRLTRSVGHNKNTKMLFAFYALSPSRFYGNARRQVLPTATLICYHHPHPGPSAHPPLMAQCSRARAHKLKLISLSCILQNGWKRSSTTLYDVQGH